MGFQAHRNQQEVWEFCWGDAGSYPDKLQNNRKNVDLPEKSTGPWCDLQAAGFVFNQFLPDSLNLSCWNPERWYLWELIDQSEIMTLCVEFKI